MNNFPPHMPQPNPPSMGEPAPANPAPNAPKQPAALVSKIAAFNRIFNHRLEKLTLYPRARWGTFGVVLIFFCGRIVIKEGFYIIAYAYGIFLLNLIIGFLSPQVDPELDYEIPAEEETEFRPFVRRVPEFKFWWAAFKWGVVSSFLTFFQALNLPVFWPILVMYFILLAILTMKDRIKHMIKYNYVPWTTGKKKPQSLLPTSK